MKHTFGKRALALALSLALCLGLFPAQALAAGDGTLYFAVTNGETLVVPPEKLPYTAGMTVKEALLASQHIFDGLANEGMIRAVDGVIANYVCSDEQGGYDLDAPADSVEMLCLDVREEGFLTPGLQALVRAMADLMDEEDDVRAAAKNEYQAALEAYPTAGSERARELAADITNAVEDYKAALEKTVPITFADESGAVYGSEVTLTAASDYGRVFTDDDGDGTLDLPWGETYAFTLRQGSSRVDGTVRASTAQTISADLPTGDWMAEGARLSLSGGSKDNASGSGSSDDRTYFEDSELVLTQEGHTLTAQVPDTYATGNVYFCAQYDPAQFTGAFAGASPQLYACYTNTAGKPISPETDKNASKQIWSSKTSSTSKALSAGSAGKEILYRVSVKMGDYTYSQEYTLVLQRSLSLSALRVTDQDGTGLAATEPFSPETREYTYRVLSTVTQVSLFPTAFEKNYTVRVDGTPLSSGSAVPLTGDTTTVTLTLTRGDAQGEYVLHFVRAKGQSASFRTEADTELRVYNQNGEELRTYKTRETDGGWRYTYTLVPGEPYHYIATRGEYYHVTQTFTMENLPANLKVIVPTEDALTSLSLGNMAQMNKLYALSETVEPGRHQYTLTVEDRSSSLFLKAAGTAGMTVQALYTSIAATAAFHGKARTVTVPNGGSRGQSLAYALLGNAQGNEITLRFSREEDGITQYQDYVIQVERALSLRDLQAECGGITCRLEPAYSPAVTEYEVTVPMAAASLDVTALLREGVSLPFGGESDGYWVEINGQRAAGKTAVPLTGTEQTETIAITVGSDVQDPSAPTQITLTVRKAAPVLVTAAVTPEEGLLVLTDRGTGARVWPGEDGSAALSEGFSYDWRLTARGFVGRGGTLSVDKTEAGEVVLKLSSGESIPTQVGDDGSRRASWILSLEKAAENTTLDPNLEAEWADFRGTSYTYDAGSGTVAVGGSRYTNNGVTSAPIPVESLNTELSWATKLGDGYSSGAVGCPILVDGDLVTYSGKRIYRVDTVSGEVLAQGTMAETTSFGINNATYYGGMIFVGLAGGRIQAFDAKTLKSLWLFQDDLGGQPNCPITVYGGYLYTGFWLAEDRDAHFVCLSITDEDPAQTLEQKLPTWTVTRRGGFYWAGAYVNDDFVLVGTDDGQSGCIDSTGAPNRSSALLMLDPRTGALLDSREGLPGDIRSAVSYDSSTDAYYFATKGGYFCQAQVGKDASGSWKITQLRELALSNGSGSRKNPAMSTCTPVVYNGRAYLGVSGVGQFTAWSGHNITVVDLASWKIAYSVPTQGYPQTSGLLTTAYVEKTQYVYVYFFDNYTPGTLRVLRDKPGQTKAEHTTVEKYTNKGQTQIYESAYALFSPSGNQAQYAICSPIADRYGTVYFKNDSAYLMAFGSAIEKLEVTQAPAKTEYVVGETFDPAGMVITAVYANGARRDVTRYLRYSQDALTLKDDGVTLTFPYVMYHNADNSDGTARAGEPGSKPSVKVPVTVTTPKTDVKVDWTAGDITVTTGAEKGAETVLAAVYDKAGRMLSVVTARVEGGVVTLTPAQLGKGVSVKVFWQDAGKAPVGEAWTVTRN